MALNICLGRANRDADVPRNRLCTYVIDDLDDLDAVGVLDETGFLQKGSLTTNISF